MPAQNYSGNAVETTLNGGLSLGATSFALTASTGFPSSNFVVVFEPGTANEEKVLVGTRSGVNCSGCTRGYDGTTDQGHSNGVEVIHVLDAATVQRHEDHIFDATAAHAATAISFTPAGSIAASTVQAAIEELDTEMAETVRDTIGTAMTAGDFTTVGVSDVGNTIKIHAQIYVPGTYVDYAGTTAPTDVYNDGRLVLLPTDGAAVSRTTYAALFAKIGTTYGAGNGTTTFNVPNHANRVRKASGTGTPGNTGGALTATLTTTELPAHTHTGPSHTHDMASHTHTGPSHTHDLSNHTHDLGNHTHDLSNHTHQYTTTGVGTGLKSGADYADVTANSGGPSSNTSGTPSSNTSGTPSTNTTGTGGTGTSGAPSTNITGAGGTGNTGSAGTGAAFSIEQSYIVAMVCIAT